MAEISRRKLLGSIPALSIAGFITPAFSKTTPAPKRWDESVDVVVIGSGFAGLAAAIEAKKAGASVAVLEKMRTAGGNSVINGGIFGVPGTPQQKALGIEDTPELMAADMIRAGEGLNHPAKVKALTEAALATYEWTVNELGVEYQQSNVKQEGGHSVPRSLFTKNGSGSEIVKKELAYLEKLGVRPRLRVFMEALLQDEAGRVIGVKVRENYSFPKNDSGEVKFIQARRGVVLAYGGFGADVEYRSMYDPKLTDRFQSTNQPGATAEAWRAAAAIGCQMIQQDWIQCLPQTSPDEKGFGIGFAWSGHVSMFGFWIDAAMGKRFINELANRKVRADAVLTQLNLGHVCIAVGDASTAKSFEEIRPGMLKKQLERGVVFEYPTLEAVAEAFRVPLEELKKTLSSVNEAIAAGKDPMGRPVNTKMVPLGTGPWYVARLSPKVHHCMGGLYTNEHAQVYNIAGKLIEGLYAAGEATGGVHGAVRLGSCAVTDCLVNGRIAGSEAAKVR